MATTQTLDEIVREYLIEAGDTSEHRYARMLQIAFSALRELNFDVSGISKEAILDINPNGTVDLPEDFISHIWVGICGSDGNVHALGYNAKMCLIRGFDDCGDPQASTAQQTSDGIFYTGFDGDYTRNGEIIGRLFGIGGGNNQNGYYKFDEENNYMVLQDVIANKIYLKYLADIRKVNGNHTVHIYDIEAVKAWMYWKDIQRNRTYGQGDKEAAKYEWIRNKKLAARRHRNFTVDEALQTIRRANQASPKF